MKADFLHYLEFDSKFPMKGMVSLFATMGNLHCSKFIARYLYARETVNHLPKSTKVKLNKTNA